jgi:hypothetical protein
VVLDEMHRAFREAVRQHFASTSTRSSSPSSDEGDTPVAAPSKAKAASRSSTATKTVAQAATPRAGKAPADEHKASASLPFSVADTQPTAEDRPPHVLKPRPVGINANFPLDPKTGTPLRHDSELEVEVDGRLARALVHNSEVTIINPIFVKRLRLRTTPGPTFTAFSVNHDHLCRTSCRYLDAGVSIKGLPPLAARCVVMETFEWIDVMLGDDFLTAHSLTKVEGDKGLELRQDPRAAQRMAPIATPPAPEEGGVASIAH